MNIGFDLRMGGTSHAGIGRYSFSLLSQLLQLDRVNQYSIFFHPQQIDHTEIQQLQAIGPATWIPAPFRHYSFGEQLGFLRLLKRSGVDLMHFPNFNHPVLYQGPFVVTIHDMVHHKISGHKKSHWLHFQAYRYTMQHAANKAKKIITVSEDARQDIIKMLNAKPEQVVVTYEGASLEPGDEQAVGQVKQTYLLERPYFLFVGTLERKKNISGLLKGFDRFLETYRLDMDLVIVGKVDRHYPEIKEQALAIRHRDRVIFTDYVFDEQLVALYQGAYAFVTASEHEGFCLPGVEAMQFGLPLILSNTPVLNEIFDNAGIYFDSRSPQDIAEKMHLLASDQQFYRQMQQKSLERGVLFDWKRTAEQTLEIYQQVSESEKVVSSKL
jgi:glycosyltransferase involved in cell wall biosynthesis